MHNFLRVYDIGNGAPIQTIKVCATTLPKAKNQFRFIFPFAGNAGGVPCKLITRLKYWISHLVNFFFDYGLRPDLSPDPSNFRIVLAAITIAFMFVLFS